MPSWRCLISSSSADSNGSGLSRRAMWPRGPCSWSLTCWSSTARTSGSDPCANADKRFEHLLTGERVLLPVRRLSPNGLEAWQEVIRAGWEGLVAKDSDSPYVGGRTLKWLKVEKAHYQEGEPG